jgi:L-ascorbate metabolism protein UlaG (beta-lactamase superfamily)
MIIILIIVMLLVVVSFLVLQQPQFGKAPSGQRLEQLRQSPNYKHGKFQNLSTTPQLTEGYSMTKVLYRFLVQKVENRKPQQPVPFVKTNLKALPATNDLLVWFGHSSYFMQIQGKTFLVDPVLSGYASPFRRLNKAFEGTNGYEVDDLPYIDYLLVTHDHYDHLDYTTIKKLKGKVGKVITALGVGEHFEHWGFPSEQVIEKDWWDVVQLENNLVLTFTPARHFSGRTFQRNNTLWTSFVLQTPSKKIFIGGDSGYDDHFAAIGKKFRGFDWAILENGQYNEAWRYIHTLPAEVLQAAKDLRAKRILPVHSSKFDLGGHPWDEPLRKLTDLNKEHALSLSTPRIGELVYLDDSTQAFGKWWES